MQSSIPTIKMNYPAASGRGIKQKIFSPQVAGYSTHYGINTSFFSLSRSRFTSAASLAENCSAAILPARLVSKIFTYAVYTSIEESLEWIGASLTIYSLLKYMQQYLPEGITIKVL